MDRPLIPSALPSATAALPSPGELRSAVPSESQDLQRAAREFESLFVSHLLKVMRSAVESMGGEGSALGRETYTELFDQEVARFVAQRGALGISNLLVRRLADGEPAENAITPGRGSVSQGTGAGPSSGETGPSAAATGDPVVAPELDLPAAARVSSGFGIRKDPFTGETRFHRGIDIAAPAGVEVRAACAGQVAFAGSEGGYGNVVVVRHPGGYETRYAHLRSIAVKTGDTVDREQIVGAVGMSGRATGPHLHFEVRHRGAAIDPQSALTD